MLQEASRAINSAFNNSFIKKLSQYLHDCVREEVKSSTFRNLKGDKDNKWIFLKGEEQLFSTGAEYVSLDGSDPKLTELMIQSDLGQKDKYLIYGYLFLVGKSSKSKKHNEFLTPLLYMPREVTQYTAYEWQRLYVTPGLSCYWQIAPHRDQLSFEEWMDLDIKYVHERSFLVDWKIIFCTFRAMLFGHGA